MTTFNEELESHYVGKFITLIKIDLSFDVDSDSGKILYISNNQKTITVGGEDYIYCPCELSAGSSSLSADSSATLSVSNVGGLLTTYHGDKFSGGRVESIRTLESKLPLLPGGKIDDDDQYEVGAWKIMQVLSFSRTAVVLSLGSELSSDNAVVPAVKMTRAIYGALV